MLRNVLSTQILIDRMIKVIEDEPKAPEDWPEDAHPNDDLVQSLSYTKMINEINHREPRTYTEAGIVEPLPLWGTDIGYHSSSKDWRRGDLD